jgi:hypothetical protein
VYPWDRKEEARNRLGRQGERERQRQRLGRSKPKPTSRVV